MTRTKIHGQSLVEFAMVVPLFLLLTFALIDFARVAYTYVSLSNGAREMARVAAISTNWTSATTLAAFNNYAVIGGGRSASTDSVTVSTGSSACAHTRDTGGTCTPSLVSVCTMTSTPTSSAPLTSCTPALAAPSSGGFVEIAVTYSFQYAPLFQNRLAGVTDVSFMNPTSVLTTTSRAYVE